MRIGSRRGASSLCPVRGVYVQQKGPARIGREVQSTSWKANRDIWGWGWPLPARVGMAVRCRRSAGGAGCGACPWDEDEELPRLPWRRRAADRDLSRRQRVSSGPSGEVFNAEAVVVTASGAVPAAGRCGRARGRRISPVSRVVARSRQSHAGSPGLAGATEDGKRVLWQSGAGMSVCELGKIAVMYHRQRTMQAGPEETFSAWRGCGAVAPPPTMAILWCACRGRGGKHQEHCPCRNGSANFFSASWSCGCTV